MRPDKRADSVSSAAFGRAFQTIRYGILLVNKDTGERLYANDHALELLARAGDCLLIPDLVRRAVNPTMSLDDRGDTLREVLRAGSTNISLAVYLSEDPIAVVTLRDIGGHITTADNIEDEDDLDGSMMTLLSQLCHEIGNPLNSMKLTLQVLMQNISSFSESKTNSYLVRTINEVARLEELLTSFKQLTARRRLETHELDLKGAILAFFSNVRELSEASGAVLLEAISEDARFVLADSGSLQQVFHNLFKNSVDAKRADQDQVTITFRSYRGDDDMVRLVVQDDGVGIPQQRLPLVFRTMYTTKQHGTGVGLSLVARLVKRMGGSTRIASSDGHGTRVELSLPPGRED